MAERLFAYGTLMCDTIMRTVAGSSHSRANGLLRGYRRRFVSGEEYPGITADPSETVPGTVYEPISRPAWSRLDLFEGALYQRVTVPVELENGAHVTAWTYVVRQEHVSRLSTRPWSFEQFMRSGRQRFESRYLGFDALPE